MEKNPLRRGIEAQEEPLSFTLVIFGATGDLTRNKLMPALFSLFLKGYFQDFSIIGFARRPWTDETFQNEMSAALAAFTEETAARKKAEFLGRLFYVASAFDDRGGYKRLIKRLGPSSVVIHYLSTPPESYEPILDGLKTTGAVLSRSRIIIEKPFGHDLESARRLNRKLLSVFSEAQVFRIDHYLGKETVQNILVLRFGNRMFEPLWSREHVRHVEITMAETIGIGNRGNYYEKAGALRDMVQNHLLQLLCLAAMEPPKDLEPDSIRDEKVRVLKAIRKTGEGGAASALVRGQYASGVINGEDVAGYREEPGVDPRSCVETYAAFRLFIDTPRWNGVPFFMRTGKRLSRRLTEISIRFKNPEQDLFGSFLSAPRANVLSWQIQPDEGMRLLVNSKLPGFRPHLTPVGLQFAYGSSFGDPSPDAYERLLLDVVQGDATLFTRNDEIEAAWEFTSSLLAAVNSDSAGKLAYYQAGSSGPKEAAGLLESAHAAWRRL